jgi:uncharacterized membrane protein YebE (DUF533 family)
MDPKKLIEQFLGAGAAGSAGDMAQKAREKLSGGIGGIPGGALGGLAAGGLLGVLLGNKKMRNMAGGIAGYGGAAALGALALKAWQTWQQNQPNDAAQQTAGTPAQFEPAQLQRLAADGKPFELALVRAMIAAANADGHIGPEEHKTIFEHVNKLNLAADDKAFVFDALARPASAYEIAALAGGPEQAAELWLASRLAIDPDDTREQAYLQMLAGALNLPAGLAEQLDRQLSQQAATTPAA